MRTLSVFFFAVVSICSLFLGLDRFFHPKSNQLAPFKLNAFQPYSDEWDTLPLSPSEKKEVDHILSQPFTFYNKGAQAYAFLSEDKQYVLKFIKQHTLKPNSWLCFVPFSFNPYYQKLLFRKKRARDTFRSCKAAMSHCQEETALIYLHLNPTHEWNRRVTLFDKTGKKVCIDIDKTCFLIQKKADLVFPRIAELMASQNIEGAKSIITAVFSLIEALGKKGVVENDPIIRKNFGLIHDQAIQIDIGKMRIDPARKNSLAYKQEIGKITGPFGQWIEKTYPELLPHFQDNVQRFSS